jgi:hypothetical protein
LIDDKGTLFLMRVSRRRSGGRRAGMSKFFTSCAVRSVARAGCRIQVLVLVPGMHVWRITCFLFSRDKHVMCRGAPVRADRHPQDPVIRVSVFVNPSSMKEILGRSGVAAAYARCVSMACATPAPRALLLSLCLVAAMPVQAVSMSIEPGAVRDNAMDREAPPGEAPFLQLNSDVELAVGLVDAEPAHMPAELNEKLQRSAANDASLLDAADGALEEAVMPDLALSAAPLMDYARDEDSGPSVMEVLRSVVTITGARSPAQPSRAGTAVAGGDSLLGVLRPLAADLLELGLTDRRVIDGTMVFSILGRGAFVVEAARDGSGLVLSELRSGFDIVLGRDPALRRPAPEAAAWEQDQPELMPASWRHSAGDDSGLRRAMDAMFGVFHGLVRVVVWVATTPLMLAIAAPVLLVLMLLGAVRRARDAAPQAEDAAPPAADMPAAGAQRRHRRRSPRRRGGWSTLLGQLRESIGFPDTDTLRESDFAVPRTRPARQAPKSA